MKCPLQLEFDYKFSRSIKERLKRQCFKHIHTLLALVNTTHIPLSQQRTDHSDLLKLRPPNTNKLPGHDQLVGEMTNIELKCVAFT